MKVSMLIEELQKVLEKHGDVLFYDIFRNDFGDVLILEEWRKRKRIYMPFELDE